MVRDGCTVVIGGLIREQLESNQVQVPLLGSLPLVGPVFRSTDSDKTIREEILVVLTPRIVREPEVYAEGDGAAAEFHRGHAVTAEKMIPLNRDHVSRRYFRLAQNAWAAGDGKSALRFAEMAVHFNPGNRAAIDLRSNIWMSEPHGDHTLPGPMVGAMPEATIDSEPLPHWAVEGFEDNQAPLPPGVVPGSEVPGKSLSKPGSWR